MAKPADRILISNTGQCLDDCILKSLTCARTGASQDGFQFRKGSLNGGKIGRVRGPETGVGNLWFRWPASHEDERLNREIVQNHDLSRAQAGSQDLLDIRFKGGSVC
jgi:hypothetical protein